MPPLPHYQEVFGLLNCYCCCVLHTFISHLLRLNAQIVFLQVYRMAADDIGCSLAEAAEAMPYQAYLAQAQAMPRSLHVVSCAAHSGIAFVLFLFQGCRRLI